MHKRFSALMVFALSVGSLLVFASLIGNQPLFSYKAPSGTRRAHSVLSSRAMIVETEPSIQDTLLLRMTTEKISEREARGIARRFHSRRS